MTPASLRRWLRGCVGKRLPGALYVHRSALRGLPDAVRFYLRCVLRPSVGAGGLPPWNILKIHLRVRKVSLLYYPDFSHAGHPALEHSLVMDLETGVWTFRREKRDNPPILHRKELMVLPGHPMREAWTTVTAREEKLGYYEQPARIGRRRGWEQMVQIADFGRAVRSSPRLPGKEG